MSGIKERFGLTTDAATNGLAVLLAVFEFGRSAVAPGREEIFSYVLVAAAVAVLWLTRGSSAGVTGPDAGQEDAVTDDFIQSQPLGLVGTNEVPAVRRINAAGMALIKSFEGCRLRAYRCPAGVWTIGYGHTGRDVVPGLVINQATADELLRQDLRKFEDGVMKLVGPASTNNNQFSALVSFAFNCGLGALAKSSVLACHKRGRKIEAGASFMKWVKGGGRVLPGLVRRRTAEKNLYLA